MKNIQLDLYFDFFFSRNNYLQSFALLIDAKGKSEFNRKHGDMVLPADIILQMYDMYSHLINLMFK